MHGNLACSSLDQPREPFADVRMFDLQKGGFHQAKPATLADAPCCFTNVFVRFGAPAAVTNDQYTT
jgi:hypothetical protein